MFIFFPTPKKHQYQKGCSDSKGGLNFLLLFLEPLFWFSKYAVENDSITPLLKKFKLECLIICGQEANFSMAVIIHFDSPK